MVFFLFSSNCSRSHASWSHSLDSAKCTKIVRSVITLDSSIKALLLTYLFTAQRKFSALDIFLTESLFMPTAMSNITC